MTVSGAVTHLTTSGTSGSNFASRAAVRGFLASEASQQVRNVYRNGNEIKPIEIFGNRWKVKSNYKCICVTSATRVTSNCYIIDVCDILVAELCMCIAYTEASNNITPEYTLTHC